MESQRRLKLRHRVTPKVNNITTGVKAGDVDITAEANGGQPNGSTTTTAVTDPAPAE
jgi:hypothetical protein